MEITQSEKPIKVKAMCLFIDGDRVLVQSGASLKKRSAESAKHLMPANYYRALGGSLNVFETAEKGIKREIKEELGSEIENLQFIQVIENIFTYWDNEKNHEIVFLYKADLVNKDLYKQDKIHIIEDKYEFDAEWISIEKILKGEVELFPKADYSKILIS